MVPGDYRDFFVASASAAGALIGLLFVAMSVFRERREARGVAESHGLRASAALTVFTNGLAVSLFALIPASGIGETATILSLIGLAFVAAAGLRLLRLHREKVALRVRDLVFLLGGGALFVCQLLAGISAWDHPHRVGLVANIAVLVVVSLLFGIARAWELIGGPQVGVVHEVSQMLREPVADGAPDASQET